MEKLAHILEGLPREFVTFIFTKFTKYIGNVQKVP